MLATRTALLGAGCCLLLLFTVAAHAADKPVKMKNVPKPVQKTMHDQSKGAKIVGTRIEIENGKKLYELETLVEHHRRDLLINPAGQVVEVEVQMELTAVPPAVQDAIPKLAPGGKLVKIESVAKGDEKVFAYEVHVQTDGKTRGFRIAPDGKPLQDGEE